MNKIAIKGHFTRGNDVIKILESLGGNNSANLTGTVDCFYWVNTHGNIKCNFGSYVPKEYKCYTLEEYEQKFNTIEKIAIQGHYKRSKDIIQILKLLGGINVQKYKGDEPNLYYYIDNQNYITCNILKYLPKGYKTCTLDEYEQKLNIMENKRTIQIDLTTAKKWYKQGGNLKEIALQAFSKEELQSLPKSWEEYCEINPYINEGKTVCLYATGNRALQFLTLNKLLQIRDYYNQGWVPDWGNDDEYKYCISTIRNEIKCFSSFGFTNYLFTFKTEKLRGEFLSNFESQLESIKEFL